MTPDDVMEKLVWLQEKRPFSEICDRFIEKKEKPLKDAIDEGAETRLRPVLMTALVATLSFLITALSTGSGAEAKSRLQPLLMAVS